MTQAMQATDVTARLAAHAAALRYDTIPGPTLERAKDLLLDHLGVALAGSTLSWTRMVHAQVVSEGGRPESTLLGGGWAPARAAALANGTAGHANEFDDTHDESLNHPGCVVMPAALAVAQARRLGGREFLAAVVAGYEAQCRIGAAVGAQLVHRGFHPTASCGVFGSAAAAASLLGLDADVLVSAWGSAASMGTGLMRFTEDSARTTIKRMHGGLPAERGVLAAQLAATGFLGPRGVVEGRWGFSDVLAGNPPLDRVLEGIGTRFELDVVSVKLYACCKMFHSMVEAIAQCKARTPFAEEDVEAVVVRGPREMLDSHMQYHPESEMSAQYSLPYTAAVAVLLDAGVPESFGAQARAREDMRRLTALVTAVEDPSLQAVFPSRFAGGVNIRLRDGRTLDAQVIDSESSPARPLSRDGVRAKFDRLTQEFLGARQRQRVADAVAHLEDCEDIGQLMALLQPA
jgi:2-methylcitrate dehydratase PrpD